MKTNNLLLLISPLFACSFLIGCNPKSNNVSWIEKDNWYELTDQATKDDIGKTTTIKVNGADHKIRLIDIDHDIDEKGNKIHTTWEFANLISDQNGNSLSYQWNDNNGANTSGNEVNTDFPNSTIRYALNGQGNNGGSEDFPRTNILVGIKDGTNWNNEFKNKTVFSMLPQYLSKKLKVVKKTVGTTTNYVETPYYDKLFLASAIEMGYDDEFSDKGYGTVYAYYKNATQTLNHIRSKQQVNSKVICSTSSLIEAGSGQLFNGGVTNYAGYNHRINSKLGGKYWLRSPYIPDSLTPVYTYSWFCDCDGEVLGYAPSKFDNAYGLAPLFCI